MLASRQRPIVRLGIEIYLDHLAPSSWPQNTENVPDIASPSIRMNTTRHHLAVYDIEMIGSEREPAETMSHSRHALHADSLETDLPFKSSTCNSRLSGVSSGIMCGLTSMPNTCAPHNQHRGSLVSLEFQGRWMFHAWEHRPGASTAVVVKWTSSSD